MADAADLIEFTGEIVTAHVANNTVAISDIGDVIEKVHGAFNSIGAPRESEVPRSPTVSIKASVKPGFVVCLDCGSRQAMLKRHLQTAHGFTAAEYRRAYALSESHPLVAPNYTEKRRALAKAMGLGQKGRITKAARSVPARRA